MGRPPLPIGTYGKITVYKLGGAVLPCAYPVP